MRSVEKGGIVIERVRLLIRQVGAAFPEGPGRQQRIANKIGISPSMLSKIEGETKNNLQDSTIKDILDALHLDPAFFFDEALGDEPDYRQYVRQKRTPPPASKLAPPPHWNEFASKWRRFGELTAAERSGLQQLIAVGDHDVADWTDWIQPAEWILARRRRDKK